MYKQLTYLGVWRSNPEEVTTHSSDRDPYLYSKRAREDTWSEVRYTEVRW